MSGCFGIIGQTKLGIGVTFVAKCLYFHKAIKDSPRKAKIKKKIFLKNVFLSLCKKVAKEQKLSD